MAKNKINSALVNIRTLKDFEIEANEVNPIDARPTVQKLIDILKVRDDLNALCAPQIGIAERVIVLKFDKGIYKEFINPIIFKAEGYKLVREKDISMSGKEYLVLRPDKILIGFQDMNAAPHENYLKEYAAEIFERMQHYLDGITANIHGMELLEGFDNLSKKDQAAVVDIYRKSIAKKYEAIEKAIAEDKDAKELREGIEFLTKVATGEVELDIENYLKGKEDKK